MAGIKVIDTDDMSSIRDAIFKVEVIGFETSDNRNYSFKDSSGQQGISFFVLWIRSR